MITINKLDRAFLELQLPSDDMYTAFVKHVENVNVLVSTYHDEALGDVQVDPTKGTVAFSAGLHGWAFTLTKFARMYAKKFGVDLEKMMQRLWYPAPAPEPPPQTRARARARARTRTLTRGDNFFNPKEKKWIKTTDGTKPDGLERAFCMFCLTPIGKVAREAKRNRDPKPNA